MVSDLHHFGADPDPHLSDKSDQEPHQSGKRDPDPPHIVSDPQYWIFEKHKKCEFSRKFLNVFFAKVCGISVKIFQVR